MIFPSMKDLQDEQEMLNSSEFESLAVAIFAIYDDVIENMSKDTDGVMAKLEEVARLHAKLEGFQSAFFQVHTKLHTKTAFTFLQSASTTLIPSIILSTPLKLQKT